MDDSDTRSDALGLESSSTLLDPGAPDSVFAVSRTIFALSESLLNASAEDVQELILNGLEQLRRRLNADRVWIAEQDEGPGPYTTYEAARDGHGSNEDVESSLSPGDFETLRARLAAGEPQYFGPGETIPADTERAREIADRRVDEDLGLIPLVHHGELRGTLGVQRVDVDAQLAPEIRTLLEGAAGVFLQALVLQEMRSALDQSQRRYRELVDTIGEVIFEVDADGRWTFLSKYWGELTGVDPDDSIGELMLDSFDEYADTQLEACLRGDFEENQTTEFDVRLVEGPDGARWVRLVLQPCISSSNEFEGVRGSIRDASRSRQSMADLQQVDRLVNFGTLAAGIGHELNNPLAFVLGNLDFTAGTLRSVTHVLDSAAERHPDDGDLQTSRELIAEVCDATRDMKDGARRLRDIVSDLRVFTRVGSEDQNDPVDLREPLESAISIGFSEIRHRATLIREFSGRLPAVTVHRGRISQVFLNLLVNAAQAFDENSDDDNRIWARLYEDGEWVVAEIEDNGPGMGPEQQSRIFEAFYTTKDPTKGTGLGLSICKNLVESEGGDIGVESQPGEGALFRIRLPASVEQPTVTDPSPSPTGGLPRLRVLVVDDEPAVARTIQRMLGRNHELTTVSDARIAVEALRSGEEYDVILSDIIMPRMNGEEFLNAVADEFEDLVGHVIFMTGGASMDIVSRMREDSSQPILEKPFTRRDLRDACANAVRKMGLEASSDE